jgi:HAD superfamily hydrolase (TIGR01459 family)
LETEPHIPCISIDDLVERYQVFLLDGYGVLVDAVEALPGAQAFFGRLRAASKEILLLSNDASRLPSTTGERYRKLGLDLAPEEILTSGQLLADHFAAQDLRGKRCIVLGTADSEEYTLRAGGVVVPAGDDSAEVIVIADDDDYPFLETVNNAISVLMRRLSRGLATHLVMPNPDVVFPRSHDSFAITSGAIAAMFECAARLREPSGSVRAIPLGKPHPPMFEAAARRLSGREKRCMVMIGDQLGTDILGANNFGIDSVLVLTGLSRASEIPRASARPTYLLPNLRGDRKR